MSVSTKLTAVRATNGRYAGKRRETSDETRDRLRRNTTERDGCWEWNLYRSEDGYGVISIHGKLKKAHRVAYELFVGAIPAGLTIDHLCRNRGCVNPEHLEPVTLGENTRRSPLTGPGKNIRKTHCPQGHAYDEQNTEWYRGGRYCRACRRNPGRSR